MFGILGAVGALASLLIVLFIAGFGIALCVFWIWMLVDAIRNKGLTDGEKIGWVLAIVFLHFLAALLYFFIGRPKRTMPIQA